MEKRILYLTLKKEWFDKILSGEKTVEYREVKNYWIKRLTNESPEFIFKILHMSGYYAISCKRFDEIHFKNGYNKNAPFMRVEYKDIRLGPYGFDSDLKIDKPVFAIKLGKILETKNIEK